MFSYIKRIHFIGIGGIGMSGIAEILINKGFYVTGSDLIDSDNVQYLRKLGAKIYIGHSKENIQDAEVVTYSSAISINENPEIILDEKTMENARKPIMKMMQISEKPGL